MNQLCKDFFELLMAKNYQRNDFLEKVQDFFDKYNFEKHKSDFIMINNAFKNIDLSNEWKYVREILLPLQKSFIYDLSLKYLAEKVDDFRYSNDVDYFVKAMSRIREIEMDVIEFIQTTNVKISIEILGPSKLDVVEGYERAKKLYFEENYEDSWRLARDIFQQDLEKNFKKSIKHFENKNDSLSKNINNLLTSISSIRHDFAKVGSFKEMQKNEQKAITKFSIEQLLNIRNFIYIMDDKEKRDIDILLD